MHRDDSSSQPNINQPTFPIAPFNLDEVYSPQFLKTMDMVNLESPIEEAQLVVKKKVTKRRQKVFQIPIKIGLLHGQLKQKIYCEELVFVYPKITLLVM